MTTHSDMSDKQSRGTSEFVAMLIKGSLHDDDKDALWVLYQNYAMVNTIFNELKRALDKSRLDQQCDSMDTEGGEA